MGVPHYQCCKVTCCPQFQSFFFFCFLVYLNNYAVFPLFGPKHSCQCRLWKMHKNEKKKGGVYVHCTKKMTTFKEMCVQFWDKSRTYDIPTKRPQRWLCTSHWRETMGFPWPMMQRNLYVRRTLSVTRTEQDSGKSTTLPPAEQQNLCTINH